jgi:predicted RND superfamily exporter protein
MRKALNQGLKSYLDFIIKNAFAVIIAVLLFVIAAGIGISKLSIDSDMLHWFDRKSDIAKLQYEINDTFKVNDPTIIMLETDGIFKVENLELIRNLSMKIKEIPGVNEVLSITEIEDVQSTAEGVNIGKLFPRDIPRDQKSIDKVKDYVMSLEKYNGSLVSADGKSAAIIVKGFPEVKSDTIAKKIKTFVSQYLKVNRKDVKPYFSGIPSVMNSVTDIIVRDIGFLVPLVAFVILLAHFVSFRHPYGTFFSLVTVAMATVAAMGIMGYIGLPLTPLGIAIPVIVMAIGNAYGIYVISAYHEEGQLTNDKKTVIFNASKRLLVPIIMSGLTVFAGFASLITASGLKAIIDFAVINSIGVILSFIFTISFLPALLAVLPMAKRRFKSQEAEKESKILHNFAVWVEKNRLLVLGFVILFSAVNIYFAAKIKTDSDYMKYFKEGSEPRIVTAKVTEVFQGTGEFLLYFKGDASDPRELKTISVIEEQARYYAGSKSRASSIVEMIATLNANMTEVKRLPETSMEINNLWFFIEGNEQISRMVSRNKNEMISTFLLPFFNSDGRSLMLKNIENSIKTNSKVRFVNNAENHTPAISLSSLMLYNRFIRRGIQLPLEKIQATVSNLVFQTGNEEYKNILSSYSRQKDWLKNSASAVRQELLKGEGRLSDEDLIYSLSPLVWSEVPTPDSAGAAIFEKSNMSGIVKLFTDLDKIVMENQITSILTAVVIVVLIIALMFRSWLTGLLSIIAVVFTVIVNFGFIGMTGIKLNFVTVTVASITIGTGIDYTIQYMARYYHEINSSRLSPKEAFIKTVATTGRAILTNALAVGCGFLVLVLSSIMPLRDFGLQMFVTMFTSSFATITLMPIVLLYFAKRIHLKIN